MLMMSREKSFFVKSYGGHGPIIAQASKNLAFNGVGNRAVLINKTGLSHGALAAVAANNARFG